MTTPIQNLISSYPTLEGSKVIQVLAQHPGRVFPASVLDRCISMQVPPDIAESNFYHFSPVPMTDWQTLKSLDNRLKQLIAAKATYIVANNCTTSPYDLEMEALKKYRFECTRPSGAIKSFNDDDRMAYRRQHAAIRRLLDIADKDGHHEAVAIVNRQLKQGRQMVWEEFGKVVR